MPVFLPVVMDRVVTSHDRVGGTHHLPLLIIGGVGRSLHIVSLFIVTFCVTLICNEMVILIASSGHENNVDVQSVEIVKWP